MDPNKFIAEAQKIIMNVVYSTSPFEWVGAPDTTIQIKMPRRVKIFFDELRKNDPKLAKDCESLLFSDLIIHGLFSIAKIHPEFLKNSNAPNISPKEVTDEIMKQVLKKYNDGNIN